MNRKNIDFDNKQQKDLKNFVDKALEKRSIWTHGCDHKMERKFLDLSEYFDKDTFNFILYNFPKTVEDVNNGKLTKMIVQIEEDTDFFKYECREWSDPYHNEKVLDTIIFRNQSKTVLNIINNFQIDTIKWLNNLKIILKRLEKDKIEGGYEQIYCIT